MMRGLYPGQTPNPSRNYPHPGMSSYHQHNLHRYQQVDERHLLPNYDTTALFYGSYAYQYDRESAARNYGDECRRRMVQGEFDVGSGGQAAPHPAKLPGQGPDSPGSDVNSILAGAHLQNLVHYRPPSQGSSPGCSSTIQSFPPPPTSYPTSMESENNDYMKAALCQIKEENQHNSA